MSNYYVPCFYRIDFVVIPSYIELPCSTLLILAILDSFLGMHGLHLNEHNAGKLVLNFVKRIRSILILGLPNKAKGGSLKIQ